ncbi:MAG: 50S ribosome-binding GTPase [Deltaproteobacteria bacterium]|nr:50S ribosome-binding GTPase [Deltaproteobacteria bacterium]
MLHENSSEREWILPRLPAEDIIVPGLTPRHNDIHELADEIPRRLRAFQYKRLSSCLWLVFLGGTGTGKSTLFNALCGLELSRAGVERPKTRGAVAYAHTGAPIEHGFPFPNLPPVRRPADTLGATPESGEPDKLVILDHDRAELAHLVLVDTPDLDSLEQENRRAAGILVLLADAVVFVTSQEKYADEVPSDFLRRIIEEEKPVYFLLNKADPDFSTREAMDMFSGQDIRLPEERGWIVSRSPAPTPETIQGQTGFRDFQDRLLEDFSPSSVQKLRRQGLEAGAKGLGMQLDRLIRLLQAEDEAAGTWMKDLEGLLQETREDLIQAESEHFAARNRTRIQREIRRLFSRYDLLSRPRRAVRNVILAPLRLLGLQIGKGPSEDGPRANRPPESLAPILASLDRFNRRALERLSPSDEEAPLYSAIRRPAVAMTRDEVEARVTAAQEHLESWLRETFQEMAQGLPTAKKWSIYSTSIIWGVLVLALEATLGGGFTVIDALLGSAAAPFLTKGSAELFAYREIQRVVRDMAETYRKGLVSILEEQRDRYASALGSVSMPPEEKERFTELRRLLEQHAAGPIPGS